MFHPTLFKVGFQRSWGRPAQLVSHARLSLRCDHSLENLLQLMADSSASAPSSDDREVSVYLCVLFAVFLFRQADKDVFARALFTLEDARGASGTSTIMQNVQARV